jgi:hypothetical protein
MFFSSKRVGTLLVLPENEKYIHTDKITYSLDDSVVLRKKMMKNVVIL